MHSTSNKAITGNIFVGRILWNNVQLDHLSWLRAKEGKRRAIAIKSQKKTVSRSLKGNFDVSEIRFPISLLLFSILPIKIGFLLKTCGRCSKMKIWTKEARIFLASILMQQQQFCKKKSCQEKYFAWMQLVYLKDLENIGRVQVKAS